MSSSAEPATGGAIDAIESLVASVVDATEHADDGSPGSVLVGALVGIG